MYDFSLDLKVACDGLDWILTGSQFHTVLLMMGNKRTVWYLQ